MSTLHTVYIYIYMGRDVRKTVFGVSDQVIPNQPAHIQGLARRVNFQL